MGNSDGPFRPDAPDRLKRGDLRNMQLARCLCGHEWWAPVIGRCPLCKQEGAEVIETKEIGVPRV